MKTVLKFVAYLEIESENLDRKILTASVQTHLFPDVVDLLSNRQMVHPKVIESISKNCQARIDSMRFIHTQDLFKPQLKEIVVHKKEDDFDKRFKEFQKFRK